MLSYFLLITLLLNTCSFAKDKNIENNKDIKEIEKNENFEESKKNENTKIHTPYEYNFRTSETNNETFNKIYNKLFCKFDFSVLNSSYISQTKELGKYNTLKLDKPLIEKYLAFSCFLGYKFKKIHSIGLRFGNAGFCAGNIIQYNLMLAFTYNGTVFSKKSFFIECEIGFGFYFLESKNEILRTIIDYVKKRNISLSSERLFVNLLFSFHWKFLGISFGGPISLRFLSDKNDLEDKIERFINIANMEIRETFGLAGGEIHRYVKNKIKSDAEGLLDFLNIRLSFNIMDFTKFIIERTQK